MQKIIPFIWLDHEAEEAAGFYVETFANSPAASGEKTEISAIARYDKAGAEVSGRPEGSVMTVSFLLAGEQFMVLSGGTLPGSSPKGQLVNPVSFVINCQSQAEVDYFWEKLSEGGEKGVCGWINRDKFGVTWQVVPTVLEGYLNDPDKEKARRVMEAMLQMGKIEIAELEKAYRGE